LLVAPVDRLVIFFQAASLTGERHKRRLIARAVLSHDGIERNINVSNV
jgi:hypothetical protein